ncbi:class I SAM-dependent methyltransferase [Fodinicurvata sediminis]|uniref:class I SAM-dependent methyltransferase n=1 Tax=Fodinicurvata sediminis TaxID=1121832 RepID=UPI0003B2F6F1|nr:class I SAM-dependent methyltransferase [Fodinicurvata sediminis]
MRCRHCDTELELSFLDLGSSPPSNSYLDGQALHAPETWFPLRVLVCEACWLVQTEDHAGRETFFSDSYAYFSSYSTSWLTHARTYVYDMKARFGLGPDSCVVEIAANDGYLLQYVQEAGIPCYGIEPTHSTAEAAREKKIDIIEDFFGRQLAGQLAAQDRRADLIAAKNVLAHVPDINDFVGGFARLLKPTGVATFEFPHLLNLVAYSQFDTVYHEHYSYLSLTAVERVFRANGLSIFDVEEWPTHGGSLRVFAQRSDCGEQATHRNVESVIAREEKAGIRQRNFYESFQHKAEWIKNDLLGFLLDVRKQGKRIAAYGAAAKGNTLLNYAGIRPDLLPFVIDRNPYKQGRYMPGSRIPIVGEKLLQEEKPDYLLLLPWNLQSELMEQLSYISGWDGRFVVAVPELKVLQAG